MRPRRGATITGHRDDREDPQVVTDHRDTLKAYEAKLADVKEYL